METTSEKIVDFQQNVGVVNASLYLIVVYVFAFMMILGAVRMAILGLMKTKDRDCKLQDDQCKKRQHLEYLRGLLIIPFCFLLLWLAHWNVRETQTDKTWGATQGALGEFNLMASFLH